MINCGCARWRPSGIPPGYAVTLPHPGIHDFDILTITVANNIAQFKRICR